MLEKEEKIIRISVRDLVEFVLREGDIDNRRSVVRDREVMLMGGRLHRKIQRRMGPEYQAEVSLKIQIDCGEFYIYLEGRADGIIMDKEKGGPSVVVDEIKGVLRDLSHIKSPVGVHLAQAKCYAYIYARQNDLRQIGVRMTYCHLVTEEIRRFEYVYGQKELQEWFYNLVKDYEKWARFQMEWRENRNQSIQGIQFPFPYRKGQRDVVASVYRTIMHHKKIFIQAPTGVGKTISTVFPSVKAVGEGLAEKIFYLTAKTVTRTVAENAFSTLEKEGLCMKTVTLTAKEKICFCEETACNPDSCPYAKGHFDRINDAVFDMINRNVRIDREAIEEQARKYRVCPFELSLDISTWADAVICDYNYVFDPSARLKRFFSEGSGGDYVLLIDEAHNLVDRGREMYSARLYKEELREVEKQIRTEAPKLAKRLNEAGRLFLALKRECEHYRIMESVSHIVLKMLNVLTEMEKFLEEPASERARECVMELYFKVRSFINIYDIVDDNYVMYSELESDGRFKVCLFCVNPARNLESCMGWGISTIFFSATLLPIHYYKELLSTEKDDYAIYAQTSFPYENRMLLLGTDVSTKYTLRSPDMYDRITRYIITAAQSKKGNYMAFFPSYRMMEEVYRRFLSYPTNIRLIVQEKNMKENEKEAFLREFEKTGQTSMIGFCVMGGVFSEGIDLAQDRLIGAVIVGTGLPQVCTGREIVKGYFDEKGRKGFDFAYLFPGMNKVLQSAGRVIRTETDRGIILLLDERFMLRQYREIFPREWTGCRACSAGTLGMMLREFWEDGPY